jgi:7,8-dihydropterin-6-yl-methyl-4-(beta-D-ribofuranosyl)aminobenzene 5'-phosphate synthase
VYDNNELRSELRTAWGFAALIEFKGQRLLFDTGGDSPTLMDNMAEMGIDPTRIDQIVLSHAHGDHTGGLQGLLETETKPTVYLLPSFPARFKLGTAQYATVIEVNPGQRILEGIYSTGEMGSSIPEQALVIHSAKGLVVVTGCAHPGVVEMVEQAISLFDLPVYLVVGGFHLGDKSTVALRDIVQSFRTLGVEKVAPCHCSGETARSMFETEFGDDYIQAGVGTVIIIDP